MNAFYYFSVPSLDFVLLNNLIKIIGTIKYKIFKEKRLIIMRHIEIYENKYIKI